MRQARRQRPVTGPIKLQPGETAADALRRVTGSDKDAARRARKPVARPHYGAPAPSGPGILVGLAIPIVTANESNGSHQSHWAVAKRRKLVREEVENTIRFSGALPPELPLVVVMRRHSAGELDDDGIRSAMKSVRDQIAAWLGVDDRDKRVSWGYDQAPCARGIGWVTVEVRRMS